MKVPRSSVHQMVSGWLVSSCAMRTLTGLLKTSPSGSKVQVDEKVSRPSGATGLGVAVIVTSSVSAPAGISITRPSDSMRPPSGSA